MATCYLCERPAEFEALDTWDRYGVEEILVLPLCERHAEALKDTLLVFA